MSDTTTTTLGLTKPDSGSTGWHTKLNTDLDLIDTAIAAASTADALKLPKTGGTMSGNIAMGGNKVTGLAAASTAGDAVRYEQGLLLAGGTMSGAIAMGSNKVTGLAAATANGDAVRWEQLQYLTTPAQTTVITNNFSTSSTTFQSTNLTASITPSSASSRIKVTISGNFMITSTATGYNGVISIFRGSTDLSGAAAYGFGYVAAINGTLQAPAAITYIDSPATTSATTYTVKIKADNSTPTVGFGGSGTQVMILEEIR